MAETPNLLNISVETANTRRYSSSWPSSKRTRSRTCVVSACASGDYNLCKWKETFCKDHKTLFGNDNCTCKPPYELFTIPSRKKEARVVWKKLINRKKGDGNQMWSPGQKSRVCSHHFIDKRPTESNPYPVLKLGYDASSKIDNIPIITGQSRKRKLLHAITSVKNPKQSKQTKLFPSENDCTEVFIQTPKDHKLQKITWSNYKHHNTMKILVSVSSNSTIIFVSKAYSGNISDKEIVKRSKYLDLVEPYSKLMVDKGFPILKECTARNIELLIPPGKRDKTQRQQSN